MNQAKKNIRKLLPLLLRLKGLKVLKRLSGHNLPEEKFEDMGAFGSNTMTFERWLQFDLLPDLLKSLKRKATFPATAWWVCMLQKKQDRIRFFTKRRFLLID